MAIPIDKVTILFPVGQKMIDVTEIYDTAYMQEYLKRCRLNPKPSKPTPA